MDRRLDELRAETRAEMRVGDAETRRHFDLVAEDLKSRIQLVAERVLLVDEKLERFRAEVHERFEAVDRRVQGVGARGGGPPTALPLPPRRAGGRLVKNAPPARTPPQHASDRARR